MKMNEHIVWDLDVVSLNGKITPTPISFGSEFLLSGMTNLGPGTYLLKPGAIFLRDLEEAQSLRPFLIHVPFTGLHFPES